MDLDSESQNAQDARVEELWKKLDTRKQGYLDLEGLKRGLAKIDHREIGGDHSLTLQLTAHTALKNATELLADVLRTVDTNGDGKIDYSGS